MAISPDLPGLTLSIRIANRKLPEYHDSDIEDPPRVVSYMIEAVPDTIFSIHAHADSSVNFQGSSLALHFYVDGKYVDGALIDSPLGGSRAEARSRGRYVRANMLRRYQFASRERQIELVETVSTSLSSRPRSSKASSATPPVSYAGYRSAANSAVPSIAGVMSVAPSRLRDSSNLPSLNPHDDNLDLEELKFRTVDINSTVPHAPNSTYRSIFRSAELYGSTTAPQSALTSVRETVLPGRSAFDFNYDTVLREVESTTNYDTVLREVESTTNDNIQHASSVRSTGSIPRMRGLTVPRMPYLTGGPSNESYVCSAGPASPQPNQPASATGTTKDVESATAGSEFTAPEELGTIKIVVSHVNKKGAVAFGRNASVTAEIGSAAQAAAKDKSGGLLVRFTAPQTVSPITTWDVGAVNENDEDTSVTYLYHYRTREMLDALGVLPKEVQDERARAPDSPELGVDVGEPEMSSEGTFRTKGKMSEMDASRGKPASEEEADTAKVNSNTQASGTAEDV